MSQVDDAQTLNKEQAEVSRWMTVTKALGKGESYLARIQKLSTEVFQGLSLSQTARISIKVNTNETHLTALLRL